MGLALFTGHSTSNTDTGNEARIDSPHLTLQMCYFQVACLLFNIQIYPMRAQ